MGAGTAKFKSLTALGEGHVAMLLDRGSIPLASTNQIRKMLKTCVLRGFFVVCGFVRVRVPPPAKTGNDKK